MKREEFDELIASTGMIHWRMPVDESLSLENRLRQKEAACKLSLWDGETLSCWSASGAGSLALAGDRIIKLDAPARTEQWPEGSPADGDYCAFGALQASLTPVQSNWLSFNRLHFQIYPDCPGMHSPMIALQLYNDGMEKIPDAYKREGYTTIHLKNHQWNDCIWEFPALPRDQVTALAFKVHSYGQELSMENQISFSLKDLCLEQTSDPDNTLGWSCNDHTAVFSTEGYWADGRKTAVTNMKTDCFHVCMKDSGQIIFTGIPEMTQNEKGCFYTWDFSSVTTEGCYRIQADSFTSESFSIAAHPLYQSIWKVLNFLYCERCGHPVGRGHGTCHSDITAEHNSLKLAYQGGWHDAGDVSQQTLQTAEVVHSLLEMAERVKGEEQTLYFRLMEEAAWGLDFILRMRFGDGYRASSAGIRRWSNGFMGDMDDCDARVHNNAFENFLISGVEAFAAQAFQTLDPELAHKAYRSACEDYHWAQERFTLKGMELPIFFEHTYNTGLSQYWATASWSASLIYAVGKEPCFGTCAVDYIRKMLTCQDTGTQDCPLRGFFYRDPEHTTIVHFNHQAREQIFIQALEKICLTQPEHPLKHTLESAMRLFGDYLKQIYTFAAPFGMLPAGLHKMDEYLDRDTFPLLHLMTEYEEEKENYKEQLLHAIPLNKDYCIRLFPIWFSFRGNTAVHLSAGKAASILGRYLNDSELTEIAREQLYWTFGKNPFGQSLVYGAGSNYAQQYGALNGEMAGSIPVGIETRGNQDIPFWPMENNATYKEVWTTSAGRWLWLAADLY